MSLILIISVGLLLVIVFFLIPSSNKEKQRGVVSKYIQILLTNWMTYAGLCISFSLSTLVNNFVDHGENVYYTKATTFEILFSAPIMFTIFWGGYIALAILCVFVTDVLSLRLNIKNVYALTIGQWIIASAILTYVVIKEWDNAVFGIIIVAVTLITQIFRAKKLKSIIDFRD